MSEEPLIEIQCEQTEPHEGHHRVARLTGTPSWCPGVPVFWMDLLIENRYGLGECVMTSPHVKCDAPPPPESDGSAFEAWVELNIRDYTGTGRVEGDAWYDVTVIDSSDPAWIGRQFDFGY